MHSYSKTKKILHFIMLILCSCFAAASSADVVSDTGLVLLTIVNRPPVITDIHFKPEVAFEDTELECVVAVNDENPDETTLTYKWYLNNELIEESSNHFTGFNKGDLVKCEVTPIDKETVSGKTKSASMVINRRPVLSAVTGFIIKEYDEDRQASLISFFIFLLVAISSIKFIRFYLFCNQVKGTPRTKITV